MPGPKRPIDALAVRRPCPVDLPPLGPGERTRHCDHCDKTVHNLSALPRSEAEALLAARGDALCVSFVRRDGRVLFDLARVALLGGAALMAGCFRYGGKPALPDPPTTEAQAPHGQPSESPFHADATLAPGQLSVLVVDDGDLSIPGVTVIVTPLDAPGGPIDATTDDDGRLLLQGLAPGRYQLDVARSPWHPGQWIVVVPADRGASGQVALTFPDDLITVGGI